MAAKRERSPPPPMNSDAEVGRKRTTLYDVLGVGPKATDTDITRAYRRLALALHPDRNIGNEAEAQAKFAAVTKAYATLSNATERQEYDVQFNFNFGSRVAAVMTRTRDANMPAADPEQHSSANPRWRAKTSPQPSDGGEEEQDAYEPEKVTFATPPPGEFPTASPGDAPVPSAEDPIVGAPASAYVPPPAETLPRKVEFTVSRSNPTQAWGFVLDATLRIHNVMPNSPAHAARIPCGANSCRVVGVEGVPVQTAAEFARHGKKMSIRVLVACEAVVCRVAGVTNLGEAGVGDMDDDLVVTSVIEGSMAELAGIRAGDRLVAVQGHAVRVGVFSLSYVLQDDDGVRGLQPVELAFLRKKE